MPLLPPPGSSGRDAARIAAVLDQLGEELRRSQVEGAEAGSNPSPEVQNLISAAVSEIQRLPTAPELRGGIAPVLGSGVLQGLLRQRHAQARQAAIPAHATVDERR